MESGNIPAHVRQDSEGSVPLPPPQASQDPYGISQREGTGRDGTAEAEEKHAGAQGHQLAGFLMLV